MTENVQHARDHHYLLANHLHLLQAEQIGAVLDLPNVAMNEFILDLHPTTKVHSTTKDLHTKDVRRLLGNVHVHLLLFLMILNKHRT